LIQLDTLLNLLSQFIAISVICVIYAQFNKPRSLIFTLQLLGFITYLICLVFKNFDLGLGIAFGLFAVFSILRYRTVVIDIKPMTYIFTVIGLSMFNAFSTQMQSLQQLIFIHLLVVGLIYFLELILPYFDSQQKTATVRIAIDDLTLLQSNNKEKLLALLESMIGQKVDSYQVSTINQNKQTATLKVKYNLKDQ